MICYINDYTGQQGFFVRPMATNFDRLFPVESESGYENNELALVFFKQNGFKGVKKRVFGHF